MSEQQKEKEFMELKFHRRSKIKSNTRNPVWNQNFVFYAEPDSDIKFRFEVRDYDRINFQTLIRKYIRGIDRSGDFCKFY